MTRRGNDRNESVPDQGRQEIAVNFPDLTHQPQVNDFRWGVFRLLGAEEIFVGLDEPAVLAAQSHRPAAVLVDEADDLLVDLPHQDHLDDIHGFLIRDAHTLDELRFLPQLLQITPDLGTTAMDHHWMDAHIFHHHHIPGEHIFELVIHHGVAAVFDHDDLIVKTADVRQGLHKYFRSLHRFFYRVHNNLIGNDSLKNITAQILVFNDVFQLFPDLFGVDDHNLLRQVGGIKRDIFQERLHNGV